MQTRSLVTLLHLSGGFTCEAEELSLVVLGDDGEVTDYQDQLKQMLQDLATEKEKDVEKPLPLMNQV